MFTQRHTAYKVNFKDLLSNEYVAREGESDYITIGDKQVSRVRVMATIVNKFTNDERKSGTLILDDGTEVISARAWENEFHLIDNSVIGQLVDIVGRVRMYNEEVYLTPEVVRLVKPDWFVLRKLELGEKPRVKPKEVKTKTKEKKKEVKAVRETASLREKILKKIGDEGATMEELTKIVGDKTTCQEILKGLLEEGVIFEPRAGRYKVL